MFKKNKKQKIIGLTGGIATGKTTVTNYLQEKYNLSILDADFYAREAVNNNSAILKNIFTRYGESIKLANGKLNRQALGNIIFNNPIEKKWLESQIHPYVREQFVTQLKQLDDKIIVLAIPLLFEANMTDLVTEIWVVICTKQQQTERLCQRNNLTLEEAEARINSQLPLELKMQSADIILDNSQTITYLYQQIDRALHNYNER